MSKLNYEIAIIGEMELQSSPEVVLMQENSNMKLNQARLELMFLFLYLCQCFHSLEAKILSGEILTSTVKPILRFSHK